MATSNKLKPSKTARKAIVGARKANRKDASVETLKHLGALKRVTV